MSDSDPTIADRALARRRREDTALVLPFFGVILLASPVLNVFAGIESIFGIPATYLFVFAVWLLLILIAHRIARGLSRDASG